jgi:hypothetical protein
MKNCLSKPKGAGQVTQAISEGGLQIVVISGLLG